MMERNTVGQFVTLNGSEKQDGQEFIGTNAAMGDLNPPIMKWLETGNLSFKGHPNNKKRLSIFVHHPGSFRKSIYRGIITVLENKDKTNVSCLGVNYQEPCGKSICTIDRRSLKSIRVFDHLRFRTKYHRRIQHWTHSIILRILPTYFYKCTVSIVR